MDFGGDRGGLVVHWDADQLDTAIEISPAGQDDAREHQHILERPMPEATFYAAVFSSVAAGTYTLWVRGEARAREVVIDGGAVTELHWEATA